MNHPLDKLGSHGLVEYLASINWPFLTLSKRIKKPFTLSSVWH